MSSVPEKPRCPRDVLKNVPKSEIDKAKDFFEMGMSAEQGYKQRGTPGRQACQILWRQWEQDLHDGYNLKINERQIIEKEMFRISLQRILFKLEYMLQKLEQYLDSDYETHKESLRKGEKSEGFKINPRIEHLRLHLLEDIVGVRDGIARTVMEPTVMEKEESEILKHMEEQADRMAGNVKDVVSKDRR